MLQLPPVGSCRELRLSSRAASDKKIQAEKQWTMKKRNLLFLFFFCFCAATVAQNLSEFNVVSFTEKPFDTAARDERYRIKDGNGDLFSIIKLVSNNADDDLRAYSFDFGLPESRVKQVDGSVWVYVQRNAMRVTIKREGYKPVRYELPVTVQPGQVFEMVLTAEALPVYREILQFNIKPAGVKATVMYKKNTPGAQLQFLGITDEEGSVAKSLELGTYIYEIHTDNYHKSEGLIELKENKGKHIESVTLRPNYSTVTLEAGKGVDIYIDDEKMGTGSWSGVLNAGTYSVECRKAKHKSVSESVTVEESGEQTFRLKSPVPITGMLVLLSKPLGANIVIDGKECGVTPTTIDGLLIGEHSVTLSKSNYKSETFAVDIAENEMLEKEVVLSNVSRMTVSTTPAGAELHINGKRVGSTPYSADFTSGDYDLRITKNGYGNFERRVHFDSSNPNLSYTLKRQHQRKNAGYVEAVGQAGFLMGAGANFGGYICNVNVEAFGLFGLSKAPLYINYTDGATPEEDAVSVMAYGARLGYGIVLGTSLRVTPQAGVGALSVRSDKLSASALTVSLGARCEYAFSKFAGLSLTPEYSLAVSKSPVFEQIAAASSRAAGWANGFNVRLGVYFYF
jgi:hypothetical protein